jgi:hypothetical protein
MKICLVVLDLLHADKQTNMAKLIQALSQVFTAHAPRLIIVVSALLV